MAAFVGECCLSGSCRDFVLALCERGPSGLACVDRSNTSPCGVLPCRMHGGSFFSHRKMTVILQVTNVQHFRASSDSTRDHASSSSPLSVSLVCVHVCVWLCVSACFRVFSPSLLPDRIICFSCVLFLCVCMCVCVRECRARCSCLSRIHMSLSTCCVCAGF